jgi:hypothetical protein
MEGVNTIVSASSSNQDDVFISIWVHKTNKREIARHEPWTMSAVFHAFVQFSMLLATIAFLHQNISVVSSIPHSNEEVSEHE